MEEISIKSNLVESFIRRLDEIERQNAENVASIRMDLQKMQQLLPIIPESNLDQLKKSMLTMQSYDIKESKKCNAVEASNYIDVKEVQNRVIRLEEVVNEILELDPSILPIAQMSKHNPEFTSDTSHLCNERKEKLKQMEIDIESMINNQNGLKQQQDQLIHAFEEGLKQQEEIGKQQVDEIIKQQQFREEFQKRLNTFQNERQCSESMHSTSNSIADQTSSSMSQGNSTEVSNKIEDVKAEIFKIKQEIEDAEDLSGSEKIEEAARDPDIPNNKNPGDSFQSKFNEYLLDKIKTESKEEIACNVGQERDEFHIMNEINIERENICNGDINAKQNRTCSPKNIHSNEIVSFFCNETLLKNSKQDHIIYGQHKEYLTNNVGINNKQSANIMVNIQLAKQVDMYVKSLRTGEGDAKIDHSIESVEASKKLEAIDQNSNDSEREQSVRCRSSKQKAAVQISDTDESTDNEIKANPRKRRRIEWDESRHTYQRRKPYLKHRYNPAWSTNPQVKSQPSRRDVRGLPPIQSGCLSVCSTTIWVGHLSSKLSRHDIYDIFGEFGKVTSVIVNKGKECAFVCMYRRIDSCKALRVLSKSKILGKNAQVAWAPGRGMRGNINWKAFWNLLYGAFYIPYKKLGKEADNFKEMEDGSIFDVNTMPKWAKSKLAKLSYKNRKLNERKNRRLHRYRSDQLVLLN